MEITVTIGQKHYTLGKAQDLSIPVRFEGEQLAAFGALPASRRPHTAGGYIGNVSQGGSCNCDVLTFSPHLHGTHTECVGHITREHIAICDVLKDVFIPATLISVTPKHMLITPDMLPKTADDFTAALIVRTLPNPDNKRTQQYETAPYFSGDAMHHICSLGVKHLLVDMPSIDKMDDDKLTNHRIFWQDKSRTVTELIYAPDSIKDGQYLLNLQLAPLASDAAPSRPLIYELE